MVFNNMSDESNCPGWLTATITLDPVLEESVVDFLVGAMGGGVEQSVDDGGRSSVLNVYFEEKDLDEEAQVILQKKVEAQLQELATIFEVAVPDVSWGRIQDQDWSSNWKVHFTPFSITKGLTIVPTWEQYQPAPDERVIIMDPGMAFGTGHHATTSMSLNCIRQVMEKSSTPVTLLDVGCGTGILGMGAALFGATEVLGIDNDPEAVQVARENIDLNPGAAAMTVAQTPLKDIVPSYDCIVANIIHDVLLTMQGEFYRLLRDEGYLILSGILKGEQENNIIQQFEKTGFILHTREQQEEWAALHFKKQPKA